jgi:putative endonuclease
MQKYYYVYILTNYTNTVIYIGVTCDLERRIYEHKTGAIEGFTKKYNIKKLVHFEQYEYIWDALEREKQLKNWHRQWKLNLIKEDNPTFTDLAKDWYKEI